MNGAPEDRAETDRIERLKRTGPATANLDKRLNQEIGLLLPVEILSNLVDWRTAQRNFLEVRAELMSRDIARGVDRKVAEQRAAVHPQMRDAIGFTAYYGSQVQVAAAALTALRGVREDLKQR